ncbi:hypothetical protein NW767_014598 [Fusarium falciforme]|nr:hypothetical protein NW767_014598 [Fusarium falciforme]
MAESLSHPLIGNITGSLGDGVIQYLGVRYATIANRLAPPELVQRYPNGTVDATKLGPQAISSPNGCDMEQSVIQQTLPHSGFDISELEPLHLNITVPQGQCGSLPVFVWIHGGGMSSGSNTWPQYDLARFVKLSSDINLPIIAIGLNYRLGVPGFLSSKTLRERGYKANNGIRDQSVALQWIQKYIAGFGGDPANVTLAGESAGGGKGFQNSDLPVHGSKKD